MNTSLEADEIVKKIYEQVRQVTAQPEGSKQSNQNNPEILSRIGSELTVLNWALGEWLSKFENDERKAKTELDIEEANQLKDLVDKTDPSTKKLHAVNKAQIIVDTKLAEDKMRLNETINMVSKLKIHRNDTAKVCEMIRTRISLIKEAVERGVPA